MLPRQISFISFSTMSVRLHPAAPSRNPLHRRQLVEFRTPRFGNSPNLRVGWNALRTVLRVITLMAIATLPATLLTLGPSTRILPALPILPMLPEQTNRIADSRLETAKRN